MPPAVASPARTPVTAVTALYEATALSVATSGDRCVLHLATRGGMVRVLLPLAAFVAGARAPVDCHGHPFPVYAGTRREQLERELAGDAAGAPNPAEPARDTRRRSGGRRLDEARRELYIAAYIQRRNEPHRSAAEIASEHTLPLNAWRLWCRVHREECEQAWRDSRPPVLKPGGSLL